MTALRGRCPRHQGSSETVQSGADGSYALGLPPGTYELAASQDAMHTFITCRTVSVTVPDGAVRVDLNCVVNVP